MASVKPSLNACSDRQTAPDFIAPAINPSASTGPNEDEGSFIRPRPAPGSARDLGAAVLWGPREGPAGWRSVVETGTLVSTWPRPTSNMCSLPCAKERLRTEGRREPRDEGAGIEPSWPWTTRGIDDPSACLILELCESSRD
jgi:hypothetical protein